MMTQGNPPPDNKPPAGFLASLDKVIEEEKVKTAKVEVKGTVTTTIRPDNYVEPKSLAAFRAIYDGDEHDCYDALLARAEALEKALLVFAGHGMMMANARMQLSAANRAQEPCGGTWVNGLQRAQMVPNESIFFDAIDACGRERVDEHMTMLFETLRKAQAAQAERDAHVEAGGKVQ